MFLDGRKINLTEMMTFFSELARLAILLIQRSHDTSPRIMTILVGSSFHREKLNGKKYYRESVLPTLANTRRIGLLENRLPRVEKKKTVGRASLGPILGFFEDACRGKKTPIFRGSALKFWQH